MATVSKMVAVITSCVMIFSIFFGRIHADPDPLQDVCVADLASEIKVNGFVCKPTFNATDFFSDVLAKPRRNYNIFGIVLTEASVMQIPGLNTLGLSLLRIDVAPGGLVPPHTHPRASEIIFVLEGTLYVGFITTADVLVAKTIKAGEVYLFPRGLVHFQINNEDVPAAFITAFDSQLPGIQVIPTSLFASTPTLPDNVLAKTFQINESQVEDIKAKFAP